MELKKSSIETRGHVEVRLFYCQTSLERNAAGNVESMTLLSSQQNQLRSAASEFVNMRDMFQGSDRRLCIRFSVESG